MMNGRELNDQVGASGYANAKMKAPKGGGKMAKNAVAPKLAGENVVAGVVHHHGTPKAIYDELFLLALNRHASPAEVTKLEQVRSGQAVVKIGSGVAPAPSGGTKPAGKGPNRKAAPVAKGPAGPPKTAAVAPGAAPSDVHFYQDVFWALLNTNEFILNH